MLWIIIFCHLIADYPFQSYAMVKAKKTLPGLFMHIAVHFLTMMLMLSAILNYEISRALSLAVPISLFHLAIDYWKNILSRIRSQWVIFIYIQDQILHILSILLVVSIWQSFNTLSLLNNDNSIFVYASGFVLSSYCWYVTEYIFSYQYPAYQQRVVATMLSRMMFRLIIYSLAIIGFNYWLIVVITAAIIVVWYDLDKKTRMQTIAIDVTGVSGLIAITAWITG